MDCSDDTVFLLYVGLRYLLYLKNVISADKMPHFYIFDLDGTLIGTDKSKDEIREMLISLKSECNFISVVSNNIMAPQILKELELFDIFDIVVAHPSYTFKVMEIQRCINEYRRLYKRKILRFKIRKSNTTFIDDDHENRIAISDRYGFAVYTRIDDIPYFRL